MSIFNKFFVQCGLVTMLFLPASLLAARVPLAKGQGQYIMLKATTASQHTVRIHAVTLNPGRYRARLVTLDKVTTHFPIARIAAKHNAFLAINGGFFTPDFKPLGLYIYQGEQQSRFIVNRLLSSLVFINRQGKLTLQTSLIQSSRPRRFSAYYAFQCGPTLLRRGLISVYKNSNKRARRTVIAQARDGKLVVMVTSTISPYDLALLLQQHPRWFGVDRFTRVANLDGGSSTAMSLHSGNAHFISQNLKTVKYLVMFSSV